jgi:hypothetical protein
MPTYPIGSVTFVISEDHRQDDMITQDLAQVLVNNIESYFTHELTANKLGNSVRVTGVEWTMGCVTIVISIGVISLAAIGGAGAVKFLKDYKDVREGLDKLLEDMKNMRVWVRRKLFRQTKDQPPPLPQVQQDAQAQTDHDVYEIMLEKTIQEQEALPAEHQKYWAAGQVVTVRNEKGQYRRYTLAVKREDIEPLAEPAQQEKSNGKKKLKGRGKVERKK